MSETIRLAGQAGMVGGSIEDVSGRTGQLFSVELATERIRAASEAARGLGFPFTVTARADGYLEKLYNLAEAIARLQAFQEAGADVLFAPGAFQAHEVASIVNSVDRPVNVLAGLAGMDFTREGLSGLGVKRISVGGGLYRVAASALNAAAREILDAGAFRL